MLFFFKVPQGPLFLISALFVHAQGGLGTFQETEVGYLETNCTACLRIESRIFPESKSPGLVHLWGQERLT